MVSLAQNLKRSVWVAPRTVTNGVPTYGTPIEYMWGWRALSSDAEMQAFGPEYMDYRKATMLNADIDDISRLDKVWMDVTPSDLTDVMASDADFYIVSAVPGAGGIASVTFKRLSPDG